MTTEGLIGQWRTDPNDQTSLLTYGDVSLRFEKNGTLVYIAHLKDKEQIIHLTYRVTGSTLITDQPSSPREERANFSFTSDGRLAVRTTSSSPVTYYVRR
jgi:hypothetical protein